MPEPLEFYSIVIVGNMNPRIHHPSWYETEKILRPDESRASELVTCSPVISHFQAVGLTIICMMNRWEIQSFDPGKLDRMLDIAGVTFDTLMHTPVDSYALNFSFVRPTGLQNVGKRLAELVNGLPLGRKAAPSDSAMITTATTLPDRLRHEWVYGMPEESGYVRIFYSVHHPIERHSTVTKFKLTPLLRDAFKEDYPECLDRAEQIAKAVAGARKE